jgi:hypothetical protein
MDEGRARFFGAELFWTPERLRFVVGMASFELRWSFGPDGGRGSKARPGLSEAASLGTGSSELELGRPCQSGHLEEALETKG